MVPVDNSAIVTSVWLVNLSFTNTTGCLLIFLFLLKGFSWQLSGRALSGCLQDWGFNKEKGEVTNQSQIVKASSLPSSMFKMCLLQYNVGQLIAKCVEFNSISCFTQSQTKLRPSTKWINNELEYIRPSFHVLALEWEVHVPKSLHTADMVSKNESN